MTAVLQGVGIGFAIAAPVGPIGMLCIRRTLQGGSAVGIASGLGAASADVLYAVAVAGGLAVTGWLLDHSVTLSLIGAALLIWMSLGMLRAYLAPDEPLATGSGECCIALSKRAAFASTFVLTAANPATIVAFVGVVAALGGSSRASASAAFQLVVGVFLGSMSWWCILVAVMHSVGRVISPSAFRWLDLAAGAVLLITGLRVAAQELLAWTHCADWPLLAPV